MHLPLLLLAGCEPLAFFNQAPGVRFTAPEEYAVQGLHAPVTLTAEVVDDDDTLETLRYWWMYEDETPIDAQMVFGDGEVSLTVPTGFDAGSPVVKLRVMDSMGESTLASMTLNVLETVAPTVEFSIVNDRWGQGDEVLVDVTVADADHSDKKPEIALEWGGSAAAAIRDARDSVNDATWTNTLHLDPDLLPIQEHTLTLTATDAYGAAGSDEIGFSVVDGDVDDDGYSDESVSTGAGGDCDDTRDNVHPKADEYCDGLDNDCNDMVDDDYALDATLWYADDDGDDYGIPDNDRQTGACEQPDGYAPNYTDCNDADATIHPGADETCNDVDDDCDKVKDDDPVDGDTVYPDGDGDGYGDGAAFRTCGGEGAPVDGDCDDDDGDVNPGRVEVCGNGVDDDCVGGDEPC